MGRLRISFISAINYTKELIESGENESAAIHKAALRFNEDEAQIKVKIEKDMKKAKKEGKDVWVCYIGPIYIQAKNKFEIISAKTTKRNEPAQNTIEDLITQKRDEKVEIKPKDWKYYSKEFDSEQKCDRYIKRKTFNNAFTLYTEHEIVHKTEEQAQAETKKYKVNEKCAETIKKFNGLKEKKFQDYMMLKTFGNDGLSPLRFRDLSRQIPNDDLMFAEGEFDNQEDITTCLKWKLRGLSIEDAIEKVKVDNAIKNR